MELDVSLATMLGGHFIRATSIPPQTYPWASLFPNHIPETTFTLYLPLVRINTDP
jgi:hypothetical protein